MELKTDDEMLENVKDVEVNRDVIQMDKIIESKPFDSSMGQQLEIMPSVRIPRKTILLASFWTHSKILFNLINTSTLERQCSTLLRNEEFSDDYAVFAFCER